MNLRLSRSIDSTNKRQRITDHISNEQLMVTNIVIHLFYILNLHRSASIVYIYFIINLLNTSINQDANAVVNFQRREIPYVKYLAKTLKTYIILVGSIDKRHCTRSIGWANYCSLVGMMKN